MYANKTAGHDRDSMDSSLNLSSRSSPRITNDLIDGPLLKKPKIEPNSDGDDPRQVSQYTRQKTILPHIIIDLED